MPRNSPDAGGARVYLVTGPSAAGKTSVARLLAQRFEAGVHLEGDYFRRSIVTGRHEMTPAATPEALAQLRLRYRLATSAANTYVAEGMTVILEDVVAGQMLAEVVEMLGGNGRIVVVLLPDLPSVAARDAGRPESGYGEWSIVELYRLFAEETPRIGTWLDTSGQSPQETVDTILRIPPPGG